MGHCWRWRAIGAVIIWSLFIATVKCQSTSPTDSATTSEFNTEIILNQEFQLLWYHWLAIILTSSILLVVLAPSAVCLFYYYKKIPQIRYVEKEVEGKPTYLHREETDGINMDALFRNMECDYHEIPRTDIRIIDRLGIGEFGPLYDAEVKVAENDVQRAMVKVFQQGTSQDLVRFREEVERLKCLDHPRVAQLFGVVSKSPYFLVAELAINGDLKTFLRNSLDKEDEDGNPALDVPKLVAMGADVASGLSYLQVVEYIHKDISARNCVVTDDLCVKIADFKVGRFLHRSEYAVQADGSLMPLRWMAPETIADNKFTLQSSVWSFGVLLWEVMSRGEYPYSKLGDEEVAKDVCENRVRLPRPPDCPDRVYKIMTECWSRDPRSRPHMSLVHRMLESSILTNKYDKSHVRLYS